VREDSFLQVRIQGRWGRALRRSPCQRGLHAAWL